MNKKCSVNIIILIGIIIAIGIAGYFFVFENKLDSPNPQINYDSSSLPSQDIILPDKTEPSTKQSISSTQKHENKIWMETDPIQCLGNPWEKDWLESHTNDHLSYRSYYQDLGEFKIITNYYNNKHQISIYDIQYVSFEKKLGRSINTCEACSCARGDTLYILINDFDKEKMLKLGYKISEYNPQ